MTWKIDFDEMRRYRALRLTADGSTGKNRAIEVSGEHVFENDTVAIDKCDVVATYNYTADYKCIEIFSFRSVFDTNRIHSKID